ncbi:MAG: DUF58 domain-containing protein [Methylobacter sp.]|nr:DUF58 domain-containing protein [Methylobacter sp.]
MDKAKLSFKQRLKLSRFFRGEPPFSGPVELTQRRVFILPTQRGLGMVFTILLLLLIAFIYNNNLVYMLGFLLASIFFVTILHTFKALAGLVVQAGFVQPVFAGEAVEFTLTVTNPGNQPRTALTVTLEIEQSFTLDADACKTLRLQAAARKRGWQLIDTVTFSSCYPLGAFRAWSPLRFDSKVLVYPKPSAFSLPFPVGEGQQPSGRRRIERSGHDDFNGIRAYQSGDPLRQIHWKAYAKGQGLFSKQYATDAGSLELWLDYRNTPGANVEDRLSQLCRWVIDAENEGVRYGLQIPGKKIAPDCGMNHYAACLESLALF